MSVLPQNIPEIGQGGGLSFYWRIFIKQ